MSSSGLGGDPAVEAGQPGGVCVAERQRGNAQRYVFKIHKCLISPVCEVETFISVSSAETVSLFI